MWPDSAYFDERLRIDISPIVHKEYSEEYGGKLAHAIDVCDSAIGGQLEAFTKQKRIIFFDECSFQGQNRPSMAWKIRGK